MTNILRKCLTNFVSNSVNCQQIRFATRWNHRRPVKVLTPGEYEEMEKKYDNKKNKKSNEAIENDYETEECDALAEGSVQNNIKHRFASEYEISKINWKHSNLTEGVKEGRKTETVRYNLHTKPLTISSQKNKKTDMLETVIDSEGNFIYTKMADNDHRVGTILTEVKSKKEKEKKDLILLEGKRLIKDGLLAGCQLKYIIFSRMNEIEYLKPFLPKFGAQLFKMPYHEMQMWSDLTTTPGIMGIFKTPNTEDFKPNESIPLTVICENIREPGNLGAILRICAGVGCQEVILTKGCVNLWDSKVLRSSAGAHFKLKVKMNIDWDELNELLDENSNIYVADNRVVTTTNSDVTNDLDEDNLNVKDILENMPVLPYYGIDFKSAGHNVLIVGGETYGISEDSYNLASKLNGVRLNVPLSNDIESLNVGAALGVIAFEIKRQFAKL